jgi:diaminopropionate ammonia-lyase
MTTWQREPDAGQTTQTPFFAPGELEAVRAWYERAARPPTPLRHLPALAAAIGIGDLLIKDESDRFGLPSFKILGAHYAIGRIAAEDAGRITDIACATAGNHGIAVAHAGREHGFDVHVGVPVGTAPRAIDAIRAAGAHVVVTSVDYDATVRLMAAEADEHGWTMVSDVAWDGYETIPRAIMAGYTRLLDEAAGVWDAPPDLVIVQAGVGGLAGAVAGWLTVRFPDRRRRPRLLCVEPDGAACVLASLRAGERTDLERCGPTIMAGLRCARMSSIAWPILHAAIDAALTVSDDSCRAAMGRLATPAAGDPAIAAGPSGACGVAAAIALGAAPDLAPLRAHLGLTRSSRYFTIVTESAHDFPRLPHG